MSADAFAIAAVEEGITATRFTGSVRHARIVDSTMNLANQAGLADAQSGVWVADEQTAGRGRGEHAWHSAPGDGLYVSLLVRPQLTLNDARWIPLATGVAVRAAVAEVTGLLLDLRWPNDLMFGDRKCGGILVESTGRQPGGSGFAQGNLRFAVIGIGFNLNHPAFPPELARLATSLYLESGREFTREEVLAAMLRQVDEEMRLLESSLGASTLAQRVREASSWVEGKRVRVGAEEPGSGGYTGWTRGLTAEGFLKVEDDSGQMRIVLSGGVRSA